MAVRLLYLIMIRVFCWLVLFARSDHPACLPRTTYRTRRGFGGHTIPKVNRHSIDRHQRSARWFARNRRGGCGILYHRHVGPVLARDWSRRMELFIATVAASAEATTYSDPDTPATTAGDTTELVIADYTRPTAVKSDYLDTAVNPAPWPTRDSPPLDARANAPVQPGLPLIRQPGSRWSAAERPEATIDSDQALLQPLRHAGWRLGRAILPRVGGGATAQPDPTALGCGRPGTGVSSPPTR